jgi:DMSO reductase anchor subunit
MALLIVIFVVFLFRKEKGWDKVWHVITVFFGVLLVVLGANYAKKSVKEWWNK